MPASSTAASTGGCVRRRCRNCCTRGWPTSIATRSGAPVARFGLAGFQRQELVLDRRKLPVLQGELLNFLKDLASHGNVGSILGSVHIAVEKAAIRADLSTNAGFHLSPRAFGPVRNENAMAVSAESPTTHSSRSTERPTLVAKPTTLAIRESMTVQLWPTLGSPLGVLDYNLTG